MSHVTHPTPQPEGYPPTGSYYAQPYPQPPPKRGMSTGAILGIVLGGIAVAFILVCGGIAAFAPDPKPTPRAAEPVTTSVPTPIQATPTATTASPPAPAGPKTSFGDGTHEVGVDIVAGKYRTTVPGSSNNCYWERVKGLSGQFTDIIANGNAEPGTPLVVTISASDKGFTSRGCGTWTKA
jgi:hypothetical protein